jgi:hypothetical protein
MGYDVKGAKPGETRLLIDSPLTAENMRLVKMAESDVIVNNERANPRFR